MKRGGRASSDNGGRVGGGMNGFLRRGLRTFVAMTVPLALLAASESQHQPRSLPGADRLASGPPPARLSVSRLLWPGAFEIPASGRRMDPLFEASGRRYVAAARSDGFLVRRSTHTDEAIDVRFVDAERGVEADLSKQIPGALSLFRRTEGATVPTRWDRYAVATFHEVYRALLLATTRVAAISSSTSSSLRERTPARSS